MKFHICTTTSGKIIPDLKVIELAVHGDARGFFVERFHATKFAEAGLPTEFPQDNHSRSAPRVIRGLHYQFAPAQGKLVGCVRGAILDVAVDIRKNSPTYGEYAAVELTDMNGRLFWMPAGFAHGFCVLGDEPADVLYKVSALYNAQGEQGIAWNDPQLKIDWPVKEPIISARDQAQYSFTEYTKAPKFTYDG